jgi:hypothetical protein
MGLCSYPEDLSPLAIQRGARTQLGSTVACLGGSVCGHITEHDEVLGLATLCTDWVGACANQLFCRRAGLRPAVLQGGAVAIPCTHGIHVSQGTVCCALDAGLMGLSSLRRGVPMGHSFPHPCKAPHVV